MAALADLVPIALIVFALAFVLTSKALVKAIFQPLIAAVHLIPLLGGAIGGALESMYQGIDNALGVAYSKLDAALGKSWHLFAEQWNWLWREIRSHASLLLQLADAILPLYTLYHAVRALAHNAATAVHGIEHGVRDLRKLWRGIEERVKQLEHDLTRGIGHDLRLSLKADEKELDHLRHKVIPAIRGDVATVDTEVGHLYDWIRGKADILGAGTFAAAVTAVLSLVGLDWLACNNRDSVNGKSGCALWNDLEALLGVAFVAAELGSLDELIGVAQRVSADVVKGAETLLDV